MYQDVTLDTMNATTNNRYWTRHRSRQTGTHVITCHGSVEGLDVEDDGPWYNICEEHGTLISHTTLALARSFGPVPLEWCEDCMNDHGIV